MCDTSVASVEDKSAYVLTQDMFDAAMTEQLTYQDDVESEEECSSPISKMDDDKDFQNKSSASETIISDDTPEIDNHNHQLGPTENVQTENVLPTPDEHISSRSVLVIETGLDKSVNNQNENIPEDVIPDEKVNGEIHIKSTFQENSFDETSHIQPVYQEDKNKADDNINDASSDNEVEILKNMLSEPPNLESIDLCDSDDTSSENETSNVELIDDELKSVMESNLMAEVGMTVNKKNKSNKVQTFNKTNGSPKIVLESVTQISSKEFNNGSWNINQLQKTGQNTSFNNNRVVNHVNVTKAPDTSSSRNQVPGSIHINKIAIPNQNFVDKSKMKCLFLRNTTGGPVNLMINSSLPQTSNKNTQNFVTQVVKKPFQLSPMEALKGVTKKHLQFYQPIMPKPGLPTIRQGVPRLTEVPPTTSVPFRTNIKPYDYLQDAEKESFIKSLLFHTLKSPYVPPPVPNGCETYSCLDCKDRFVLQSSLNHHLNRRSLVIRYWCPHCRADLVFYNRCVFLKHLRTHSYSIGQINFNNVEVSPLPKNFIEHGVISKFFSSDSPTSQKDLSGGKIKLKETFEKIEPAKKPNTSIVFIDKSVKSTGKFNPSNQKLYGKLTAEPVQVKNKVSQSSLLVNKSKDTFSNSLLPSTSTPSLTFTTVKNSQTQTPKLLHTDVKQTKPKSVILICNKSPTSMFTKQHDTNTQNALPPNEMFTVCETKPHDTNTKNTLPPNEMFTVCDTKPHDTNTKNTLPPNEMFTVCENVIIDDDTKGEKIDTSAEDDYVDVENVNIESELLSKDQNTDLRKENNSDNITKAKGSTSEPLKTAKRACTECAVHCYNVGRHLSGNNRPLNPAFTCKYCDLVLPTRCGLKVHWRIHTKSPPFKCPDCGKDFEEWQDLNAHLKFSCGHLAKCIRYLCVACKAHFPSANVLSHHIIMQHSRDIFRCGSCPVAFYNKSSLDKHILTNHPNESAIGINQKQCSLCPKKLVPLSDFATHIQEHTNSNLSLIYGFKCPMCSVIFANKMAFIIHQIKEKKELRGKDGVKTKKSSHPKLLSKLVDSKLSTRLKETNTFIEESERISDSEPEIELEETELTEGNLPSMVEKDPLSLDGWEVSHEQRVQEKKEELCIVCKINHVYILPGIDINKQSLCCKQCVKPLDVDSAVVNSNSQLSDNQVWSVNKADTDKSYGESAKSKKSINGTKKRRTSIMFSKDSSSDKEGNFESYSEFGPPKKKNRKKIHKDHTDPANHIYMQGQVVPYKSPGELVCSKCNFVADTKAKFLIHITVHRTDPHTYQCLECGLCFVVLPSLERHLQMNHGIKDVNEYIRENKSSMPQKNVLEPSIRLQENQCRVCFKVCESSSSLEKHFRTHGMAFMSSLSKSP